MIIGFPYRFLVMYNSILKKRKVNLKYVNGKKRRLNVRLKMCYVCV